jgi:hypothetical protein
MRHRSAGTDTGKHDITDGEYHTPRILQIDAPLCTPSWQPWTGGGGEGVEMGGWGWGMETECNKIHVLLMHPDTHPATVPGPPYFRTTCSPLRGLLHVVRKYGLGLFVQRAGCRLHVVRK